MRLFVTNTAKTNLRRWNNASLTILSCLSQSNGSEKQPSGIESFPIHGYYYWVDGLIPQLPLPSDGTNLSYIFYIVSQIPQ